MKRLQLTLVALLGSFALFAATPLEGLNSAIEALGCYDVSFTLDINNETVDGEGRYRVDGDRYSFDFMGQTLFGDGAVRYTINHAAQEVVIEPFEVGSDAALLLMLDPTKAFVSLDSYFDVSEVEFEGGGEDGGGELKSDVAILQLTPKDGGGDGLVDMAFIQIDAQTNLPSSVTYITDGEVVRVDILSISHSEDGVLIGYPSDYEVIDIR